jgi:hypothetical protein
MEGAHAGALAERGQRQRLVGMLVDVTAQRFDAGVRRGFHGEVHGSSWAGAHGRAAAWALPSDCCACVPRYAGKPAIREERRLVMTSRDKTPFLPSSRLRRIERPRPACGKRSQPSAYTLRFRDHPFAHVDPPPDSRHADAAAGQLRDTRTARACRHARAATAGDGAAAAQDRPRARRRRGARLRACRRDQDAGVAGHQAGSRRRHQCRQRRRRVVCGRPRRLRVAGK